MDFISALQTIDTNLLIFILIILVGVLIIFQIRRHPNVSTPLQNLTQTIQDVRVETANLQNLTQTIQDVRVETAKLNERFQTKSEIESQMAQSIKRLEMVMAGSATVGGAAENLIEEYLTLLPAEWQTRNFQIGNKMVEFGLRLPNGLVLPIDSKWVGASQLDQLNGTKDPDEQKKLRDQIEKQVVTKAKEVQKYINPEITTPYGIAVVPDAVYNLCPSVNITTLKFNVTVISYSLLLPYLLLTVQTNLATAHNIDVAKIGVHLKMVEQTLQELSTELEGRYSKGMTMLTNSRETMQKHLSKANSALVSISTLAENQEIEVRSNGK